MRSGLPQETQTAKLKSLPDDLRKIADDLLADKFGVEEEVVEFNASNPFPKYVRGNESPYSSSTGATNESYLHSFQQRQRVYGDSIKVTISPRDGTRSAELQVAYPSFEELMMNIRRLEEENITKNMKFYFSRRFYNCIRALPEYRRYADNIPRYPSWNEGIEPIIDRIMGIDVIINPMINTSYITAEF